MNHAYLAVIWFMGLVLPILCVSVVVVLLWVHLVFCAEDKLLTEFPSLSHFIVRLALACTVII